MPSLQGRALRELALLAGIAWLVVTAGLCLLADREASRTFDEALKARADAVLAFSQHELDEEKESSGVAPAASPEAIEGSDDPTLLYQVWQADGRLAFRSANAPQQPLLGPRAGFSDSSFQGHAIRGFAAWDRAGRYQIQIVEATRPRTLHGARTAAWIALTMAAALGVFLWRMRSTLRHAFEPLHECASALLSSPPGRAVALPGAAAAPELRPLIEAFNRMAGRVQRALEHEQRFTSHAAHELKTPLAAMKVMLRNAERAGDEHERRQALARLHEVVDRSCVLVERLLALARYDRDPRSLDMGEAVDLPRLAGRVREETQPLAQQRRVTVTLEAREDLPRLLGNEDALHILLRNLLDNAIQHAKTGGRVIVSLQALPEPGRLELQVHDDGPGVPAEWATRVFAPFVRGPDIQRPGTGLGLAIAERVAELHGGSISLQRSSRLGGTAAMVELAGASSGSC